MTISIRKKITISFILFIMVSTLIWFLNYYKYDLINEKLQIIEKKDQVFNLILEARRFEKNYFLLFSNADDLSHAIDYVKQAEDTPSKRSSPFTAAIHWNGIWKRRHQMLTAIPPCTAIHHQPFNVPILHFHAWWQDQRASSIVNRAASRMAAFEI